MASERAETPSSSSTGPSSPEISALEELELIHDDDFQDIGRTPTKFNRHPATIEPDDVPASPAAEQETPAGVPTFRSIRAGSSPRKPPSINLAPSPTRKAFVTASSEQLADIPLDGSPIEPVSETLDQNGSYSLAPTPAPLALPLPSPSPPRPVQDTPKASFFASALSFGQSQPRANSPPASRTPSATSTTGTWRSFLSRSTPTEPTAGPSRQSSTSLLVNRVESEAASRDRRNSRQDGAEKQMREGFERIKGEMESAAREMRREREATGDRPTSSDVVDWVFWGAVVQDFEEVARTQPRELSKAIQQGIPPVIRGSIWQLMSSSKSNSLEEMYKRLLRTESPHEKAIQKDLSRTFPNQAFFQDVAGRDALFNVVKAYSLYDEDVGYTQGLAFIVAALLLNMPDEEAFCVLVRLMESYNLRSHFLADMPGLQLRLYQFDHLLEETLPLIHTHLVRAGIKSSMYASQWFMTLFSYRCPLPLVYRILDIVLAEGVEAIFRFALSLLKRAEERLLQSDFEQILHFLQSDVFEAYRDEGDEWKANDFVRDAYEIRITSFMLDAYETEYEEQCRVMNRHAHELDMLRNANRQLSSQVKQLEASLTAMDQEHVDLVRQLVMSKVEKEEIENELVRYKMLYAELAHEQEDARSVSSRLSHVSLS